MTVTTGLNGHGGRGRFGPGNTAARGNPNNRRMYELRSALLDRVTAGDVTAIVDKLLVLAKGGDLVAARLFLENAVGKPPQPVELSADPDAVAGGWGAVRASIMSALSGHPEARLEVALALRKLAHAEDDVPGGPGDDIGPRPDDDRAGL